jgi:integrase
MEVECIPGVPKINPLKDADFDPVDANGWYRYVADSLVLTGLARRSGEAYAREIRILVHTFKKAPYLLTESDLRNFILERHKRLNGSSQRILYRGLRFLYNDLFNLDWELLKSARAKREIIEPTILSRQEVNRLLRSIKTIHIYAYLRTVYSCGLRLSEALYIHPGDIDRAGGIIHIRQGKGAKDRKVVLPPATLRLLERYWRTHGNREWLFPALGRDGKGGRTADGPMSISAVQGGLRRHLKKAGITKSRVSVHTLRHSYATHLLEAGVPLTVLQQQMGHEKIETTLRYVHLSNPAQIAAEKIIGELMRVIR